MNTARSVLLGIVSALTVALLISTGSLRTTATFGTYPQGAGCGFLASSGGNAVQALSATTISCVIGQVAEGNLVPLSIAGTCGLADVPAVLSLVEQLIGYYANPPATEAGAPEAGVSARAAVLCGDPGKPLPGQPVCIPASLVGGLAVVRDAAKR